MQKFKDFIYYNRKDIILIGVMLLLFISYLIVSNFFVDRKKDFIEDDLIIKDDIQKSDSALNNKIIVDIKGEVKNPSTYEVNIDDRVFDVINLANGLTENADVTEINLSEKVYDEMVIIIPSKNTNIENSSNELTNNNQIKKDSKISINSASIEELMTLDGIGKAKAKNIIDYRNKKGKFKSIEEIKNVSGIGETLFEKIKNNIKV